MTAPSRDALGNEEQRPLCSDCWTSWSTWVAETGAQGDSVAQFLRLQRGMEHVAGIVRGSR